MKTGINFDRKLCCFAKRGRYTTVLNIIPVRGIKRNANAVSWENMNNTNAAEKAPAHKIK